MRPSPDAAAARAARDVLFERLRQLDALLLADSNGGSGGGGVDSGSGASGGGDAGDAGSRGGYAVGGALSLADCGFPAAFHYAELLLPALGLGALDYAAAGAPRVRAWREALWRDPAVAAVLDELRPAADEWLRSKMGPAAAAAAAAATGG